MNNINKQLFIFGTKENSECLAFDVIKFDKDFKLSGFIEDEPKENKKFDLPVYSTEYLISHFDLSKIYISIPISKNRSRERLFHKFKSLGVNFYTYISPHANVWDLNAVGLNCVIQEFNNIQYGTYIGDNCLFWAGNHIGHHGKIGNSVQLTSQVVISGRNTVGDRSYFGVNSSTRDGLSICEETVLGMSSGLIKNTKVSGLYTGFPAVLSGKVDKYI